MGCNGRSEALARSDTGGRTWSIVSLNLSAEATSGGVSVWPPMFSDDDGAFGLAAPGGGFGEAVYSTSNGGRTWTGRRAPLRQSKAAFVDVVSPTVAVIPGGFFLYSTVDTGRTWSTVRSSLDLTNFDVTFTDVETGWAWNLVQPTGVLFHTVNGGRTWSTVVLAR